MLLVHLDRTLHDVMNFHPVYALVVTIFIVSLYSPATDDSLPLKGGG